MHLSIHIYLSMCVVKLTHYDVYKMNVNINIIILNTKILIYVSKNNQHHKHHQIDYFH